MKQKVTLQLEDLTCPSCMTKIQSAVSNQAGVEDTKVLFNASKVKAVINDDQITADDLAKVVKDLGYDVLKTKVKEVATA